MNLQIKKLAPDDLPLAKQLLRWFQTDDGVAAPVLPSDSYLTDLLLKESFHILVAMADHIFIGGLTAFETPSYFTGGYEMFLYEIAIINSYRQQGVAIALIEKLKAVCHERKINVMYVGTGDDNIPAQKLYATTGGRKEGVAWYTYNLKK